MCAMPATLLIPGFERAHALAGRPRLPMLERMLGRATALPARPTHACLAALFGLEDLAVAPFMRLAEGGAPDAGYWLRADPMHLAPDRDQLVLMPPSVLEASLEETRALAATFAATYGAEGWRLEFPHPERGYLRAPRPLHVQTHDPEPFIGGPVLEAMPTGPDSALLKQLMNETQMLFHTHPVNTAREDAGRTLINSLWFWGGGGLPPLTGKSPARSLGDLPLLCGLSAWAGTDFLSIEDAAQVQVGDVIGLDARDPVALERHWFSPLFAGVKAGRLDRLDIHLGGLGNYSLGTGGARRFWRTGRRLDTAR